MPLDTQKLRQQLGRYAPITAWLPAYARDFLRSDLISGVTVWGVMVPVAMGYAPYLSVAAAVHDFEERNQPTGGS